MKLHRIFLSSEHLTREGVSFPADVSRRLHKVLRLKEGDHVEVFDGCSGYIVRLTSFRGNCTQGTIIHAVAAMPSSGIDIALAFCCVRPGPMEEIMRHATELGVSRLIPLLSIRNSRKPQEKKDRWISIVKSAAQQCGRVGLPEVEEPQAFAEFIQNCAHPETRLILSVCDPAKPILSVLEEFKPRRLLVVVGPEGGLDSSEEALAFKFGFRPVCLGPRTLRTETAALVSVGAIIMWNDRLTKEALGETDSA
jgi:16S rRNA (uracil1498-N3)-methyltransferase